MDLLEYRMFERVLMNDRSKPNEINIKEQYNTVTEG